MAAVRCAARRLGGSLLQRTQAAVTSPAVAEERGRLFLPRLVHTQRNAPESIREALRAVQEQKEDLYDLIALTEQSTRAESVNRELLRTLSVQIEPRPNDPQWRSMRVMKRTSDVMNIAGVFSCFFLGGFFFAMLCDPVEGKELSGTVNKKTQELDAAGVKEVAHV